MQDVVVIMIAVEFLVIAIIGRVDHVQEMVHNVVLLGIGERVIVRRVLEEELQSHVEVN
jgi:hypothetical protein